MLISKLSFVPLPRYRNIAKTLAAIKNKDLKLKESLHLRDLKTFWFSRSAWALFTIVKFRMQTCSSRVVNIWIPDYFCNSSLVPLRSLGVNIYFYPILMDRKPDLSECKNMLKINSPDVILFVDFFGEALFSDELFDFAKDNNAWLVQDCAHCLKPVSQDKDADFVLFSPHKLLSIPDGGMLVVKENGPSNISNEILKRFDFNSIYYSVIHKDSVFDLTPYKWLLKRLLQKLGVFLNSSKAGFNSQESSLSLNKFCQPLMSEMAKKILFSNCIDFNHESQIRKKNYNEWRKLLIKNTLLNSKIEISPIKYVPYLAEIKVRDKNQGEKIFDMFKKAKIPISTWPDLAPEVLSDNIKHNIAIEMRLSRIFLPVHSSINPDLIRLNLKNLKI
jgi:hypothetical protein